MLFSFLLLTCVKFNKMVEKRGIVCGLSRAGKPDRVNAKLLRDIARWQDCSPAFRDWKWFMKFTFELYCNNQYEQYSRITSSVANFENYIDQLPTRELPAFVKKNKSAKSKFKSSLVSYWELCFDPKLPFLIVPDERFTKGFKVVARNEVKEVSVEQKLTGLLEPLNKVLPTYKSSSQQENREEIEEIFCDNYSSVISLSNGVKCIMYGPLQYVNHRCESECVYVEEDEAHKKDTYNTVRNTIIKLGPYDENVTRRDYKKDEEITVRYGDNDGEPFFDPCMCCDCNPNTEVE